MANGEIYEKNLSNASGIGSGDYLRTVNSNNESEKINYTLLAKAIIEQWTGSTLAGSAQSVKSALDSLNSNSILGRTATYSGNVNDLKTPGIWYATTSATNIPTGYTAVHIIVLVNSTRVVQIAIQYGGTMVAVRTSADGGSTWGDWRYQPTRAEMDALNSKWSGTTLLAWGTYSDGTYNLTAEIERYGMLYIALGGNGTYNFIAPCGQAGDRTKQYTEDGWVTISFPTASTVTISGTGSNSRVREIRIFKNFKFTL